MHGNFSAEGWNPCEWPKSMRPPTIAMSGSGDAHALCPIRPSRRNSSTLPTPKARIPYILTSEILGSPPAKVVNKSERTDWPSFVIAPNDDEQAGDYQNRRQEEPGPSQEGQAQTWLNWLSPSTGP